MENYTEEQIKSIVEKYNNRLKSCSKSAYKYHEKNKNDNEYKNKKNERAKKYYQDNKEKILEQLKEKRRKIDNNN